MATGLMTTLDATKRNESVAQVASTHYDLIIIGGGITGAGICLDAASRGLKTLLLEKKDFASGTSSKSTKLIHGGLRYLKQFEIGLVRETGMERAVVHGLAPHLVRAEKMLLPLIKDGTYGKLLTSFGLMVYDVLAGVEREDQRKMLSKEETLRLEPLLREEVLEGSGLYAEYRTDDARLTMEVLKTAATYDAHILNYAKVVSFVYDDDKQISGVKFKDKFTKEEIQVTAKYVINAAGPWVDKVRSKDSDVKGKQVLPTKGVHIVIPKERLPIKQAVYFDEPSGRMLFAIPRDRVTYVGTTDTKYEGSLDDLEVETADVQYLLDGANNIFPNADLKVEDVASTWVGLRPLIEEKGKSASEISRKDEIFESTSGLLSIAGGKLTGYRKMAERILNKVSEKMERKEGKMLKESNTKEIVLTGGKFQNADEVELYTQQTKKNLEEKGLAHWANYLVSNYGKQTERILANLPAHDDVEVALALAELEFTVEHESVYTLLDFFERRTGRLYFYIESIEKLVDPVTDHMATLFDWSGDQRLAQKESLLKSLRLSTVFV